MSPDLLEGAVIAVGAFLAGQWLPRPHRRGVKAPKPVQPICGCEHNISYHDPKTGECHGMMKVPSSMSRDSYHKPCTCRQYTGPQPLPEFYAPELGG